VAVAYIQKEKEAQQLFSLFIPGAAKEALIPREQKK